MISKENSLSSNDENLLENEYLVKSGDTLYAIAVKFGVSVDEIKEANNLKSNILTIGQKLIIPDNNNYKTYTVVQGDTLYGIANKFGTSVDKIKTLNNLISNNLNVGQKILIP